MKSSLILFAVLALFVSCATSNESNAPFGWAVCSSLDGEGYDLTGGAANVTKGVRGNQIVLTSTGEDMKSAIEEAVAGYDIVILDGSCGVFPISTTMILDSLSHKTIAGINGAHLRSISQVTPEMLEYLTNNKDRYMSDKEGPDGLLHMPVGTFSTKNRSAYAYRRALLDYTGDNEETLCHSGMFKFASSSDIILRNIRFEGTGEFRGLAENMLRISDRSHNIWVDHCLFEDPSRCCAAVSSAADFVTFSNCIFRFTERSGDHTLGMLISSSDDSPQDEGHLNITIANCYFDHLWSRLPMGRYGHIHIFNNYYDCPGSVGINPRTHSFFLVEGNYFEDQTKAFCTYLIDTKGPYAAIWENNRYGTTDSAENIGNTWSVPYSYKMIDVESVKETVTGSAGPVLCDPLKIKFSNNRR